MPIDPNKNIYELLKNASAGELKAICKMISPYTGNTVGAPQVMDISPSATFGGGPVGATNTDIPRGLSILEKYGLIDRNSAGEVTGVHPALGEKKEIEFSRSFGGSAVLITVTKSFIVPKGDFTGTNASPFDAITSTAQSKIEKENAVKWEKTIEEGYRDKTVIPELASVNGQTTIIYKKYDPELTKKLSDDIAEYNKNNPNNQIKDPGPQYTLIEPPTTVVPGLYDSYALGALEQESGIPKNLFKNNRPLSPTAQAISAIQQIKDSETDLKTVVDELDKLPDNIKTQLKNGEIGIYDALKKSGKSHDESLSVIQKLYNTNAVTIKLANLGVYSDNISILDPVTGKVVAGPGGQAQSSYDFKDFLITLRRLYNYGKSLEYLVDGVKYALEGDYKNSLKNLEKSGKYVYKELVSIPLATKFNDKIADVIVSAIPERTPVTSGRHKGRRIVYKNEVDEYNKYMSTKGQTPERIPPNTNLSGGRRTLSSSEFQNLEDGLKELTTNRRVGIISGVGQAILYGGAYGVPVFVDTGELSLEGEKRELYEKILSDSSIGQKFIYLQTTTDFENPNGMKIGSGDIQAINPSTGEVETINFPPCLKRPRGRGAGIAASGVPLEFGPGDDDSYLNAYVAPEVLVQSVPYPEPLSFWEKIAITWENGAHYILEVLGQTPLPYQFWTASNELATVLGVIEETALGRAIGAAAGKEILKASATAMEGVISEPRAFIAIMAAAVITHVGFTVWNSMTEEERQELIKKDFRAYASALESLLNDKKSKLSYELDNLKDKNSQQAEDLRIEITKIEVEINRVRKFRVDGIDSDLMEMFKKQIFSTSSTGTGGVRAASGKRNNETIQSEEIITPVPSAPKITLPQAGKDPYLASDTCFCIEVEEAKNQYRRFFTLVQQELKQIGDMMANGSSPVPPHDLPIGPSGSKSTSFVVCQAATPESCQQQPPPPLNTDDKPREGTPEVPTCFPEYVLIQTPIGYKKISEFNVGEPVMSFNEDGILEEDFVSNIFIHENIDIYRYYFDNNRHLDITKNHPVLTSQFEFKEIGLLKIGDFIVDVDNNNIQIIKIEFLSKGVVYNIEVNKNHTYIADDIRVHNKTSLEYYKKITTDVRNIIITSTSPDEILPPKDTFPWQDLNDDPPGIPDGSGERMPTYRMSGLVIRAERGVPGGTPIQTNWTPYADSPVARNGNTVPKQILSTGGNRIVYSNAPVGYTAPTAIGGTCFPYSSLILTPNGYRKIGEILVGELVCSFDIKGNKIISPIKYKTSHDKLEKMTEVFEYNFSNNFILYSTNNHSVPIKNNGKFLFSRLSDIEEGDILFTNTMDEISIISFKSIGLHDVYHVIPENGRLICIDGILVDTMAIE